ncbi:hypothetical protein DFH09DRAFT_1070232 [Mycena vulgaris]|nr:hypothetical protein DFH09DRAFT_1070232 [Mycena vulgaris]
MAHHRNHLMNIFGTLRLALSCTSSALTLPLFTLGALEALHPRSPPTAASRSRSTLYPRLWNADVDAARDVMRAQLAINWPELPSLPSNPLQASTGPSPPPTWSGPREFNMARSPARPAWRRMRDRGPAILIRLLEVPRALSGHLTTHRAESADPPAARSVPQQLRFNFKTPASGVTR